MRTLRRRILFRSKRRAFAVGEYYRRPCPYLLQFQVKSFCAPATKSMRLRCVSVGRHTFSLCGLVLFRGGARNFLHWRVLMRHCSLASVHCSVCQFCVHEYFSDVGFSWWQVHSFSVWHCPLRGRRATFCIGGYSHDIFVCKRVLFCAHCA